MDRTELFSQLMDSLFSFSQISGVNQNIPRTYGTDDILYIAEVHLLRDIANNTGITVTQLAQMNNKSKSAISQMIDKLYQKNLIEKRKHPDGKRQFAIYLTDRGETVNKYHSKFDRHEYSQVLKQLNDYSDEDFQRIITLLDVLSRGSQRAIKQKKKITV